MTVNLTIYSLVLDQSVAVLEAKMKTIGSYEAKTHLPRLLEEVVNTGVTITITKHGVPVAQLTPMPSSQNPDINSVIQEIRSLRQSISLNGLSVQDMIAEGRRF